MDFKNVTLNPISKVVIQLMDSCSPKKADDMHGNDVSFFVSSAMANPEESDAVERGMGDALREVVPMLADTLKVPNLGSDVQDGDHAIAQIVQQMHLVHTGKHIWSEYLESEEACEGKELGELAAVIKLRLIVAHRLKPWTNYSRATAMMTLFIKNPDDGLHTPTLVQMLPIAD